MLIQGLNHREDGASRIQAHMGRKRLQTDVLPCNHSDTLPYGSLTKNVLFVLERKQKIFQISDFKENRFLFGKPMFINHFCALLKM